MLPPLTGWVVVGLAGWLAGSLCLAQERRVEGVEAEAREAKERLETRDQEVYIFPYGEVGRCSTKKKTPTSIGEHQC